MRTVLNDLSSQDSAEAIDRLQGLSLREAREQFEREFIRKALLRNNGKVGETARSLGMQRTNLYRKVRQLKLPKSLFARQK